MLKYDVDIPVNGRKGRYIGGRYVDAIKEFYESGAPTAEFVPECVRIVNNMNLDASGLYNAARRSGLPVRIVQRKYRLFLIRTDKE